MKRYKLLKDLPTFNAGDEFVLKEDGCLYLNKVDAVKGWLTGVGHWKNDVMAYHKRTLAQFPNILEDWFEEIEDPKEHYFISEYGKVFSLNEYDGFNNVANPEDYKEIGNYFESEEEAELAVRRLKAWKRLENKGFKFVGWQDSVSGNNPDMILFKLNKDSWETDTCNDLDICFGGEE